MTDLITLNDLDAAFDAFLRDLRRAMVLAMAAQAVAITVAIVALEKL